MTDVTRRRIGFYVRGTANAITLIASSHFLVRPVNSHVKGSLTGYVAIQWSRYMAADSSYGKRGGDGAQQYTYIENLWIGARRWFPPQKLSALVSGQSCAPTEQNMGKPAALTEFCAFAFAATNTEDYLVLFGHGGPPNMGLERAGALREIWRSDPNKSNRSWEHFLANQVAYEENQRQALTLREVGVALRDTIVARQGAKLDALLCCQCLMATIEVLYEYKDVCKFFVASQPVLGVPTWDHTKLLDSVFDSAAADTHAALTNFIDDFAANLGTKSAATLALVQMQNASSFFNAFNSFVDVCARDTDRWRLLFKDVITQNASKLVVDVKLAQVDFKSFLSLISQHETVQNDAAMQRAVAPLLAWLNANVTAVSVNGKLSGMSIIMPFAIGTEVPYISMASYFSSCSFGDAFPAWIAFLEG